MFVQVHFLTSYPASLLNRDDAGLAKRINFGGAPRLRVSSQCQKRHWRENLWGETEIPRGERTRYFFSRVLKEGLISSGVDCDMADVLVKHLAAKIIKSSDERSPIDPNTLMMKQPVLFGRPEADYLLALLKQAVGQNTAAEGKKFLDDALMGKDKNFAAMLRQGGYGCMSAGFEGALFGRFVTSDILSRVDAPVHVAHAFTTHALDTEVDYFTVVDDLSREEETGAAHANDMELGAGIFYGYVAVDVPLLVSNVTASDAKNWRQQECGDVKDLLALLLKAITQVSPGAKLGATAPYSWAECVLIEVGCTQPRTLANAFLRPVRLGWQGKHPMAQSVESLQAYMGLLDKMYGTTSDKRFVATIHEWSHGGVEASCSLPEAIQGSIAAAFEVVRA